MFYASHPIIERLRNEGAFSSENNAFVTALSFKAADLYLKGNRLPSVFAEAANNARNVQYSSFFCLLASSSVIKQSIQTYYPLENDSKSHSCELFFNCNCMFRKGLSLVVAKPNNLWYSLMKIGQPCFLPSCQRALPFIAHSSSSRGTSSDLGQKPIKSKQTTIADFVLNK